MTRLNTNNVQKGEDFQQAMRELFVSLKYANATPVNAVKKQNQ